MKISKTKPKEYDLLKKHFPELDFNKHAITIRGIIHAKNPLTADVFVHELVHVLQQKMYEDDRFLDMFLNDKESRLNLEIIAYNAQYTFLKQMQVFGVFGAEHVNGKAIEFATTLSGPLYGNIITYKEALKLITKE